MGEKVNKESSYTPYDDENAEYAKAMRQWDQTYNYDYDQRDLGVEDLLFLASEDGQWDEDISTKRKDRPRFQIDRISPAKDQIIGNQLQEVIGPEIYAGTGGTKEIADVYVGIIRNIENESNADNIYDHGFDEQITSGYGGWRILTKEETENPFNKDQIIYLQKIDSAASSLYFDPSAVEYDKRDAMWCFLTSYMMQDVFKKKYPGATITDFSAARYKTGTRGQWFGERGIRIAEYWYKEPYTFKYGLMTDDRIIDLEAEEDVLDELEEQGITVQEEAEVEGHKIFMRQMNGAEFITEPQEWMGKFIPLIPVYGKTAVVDGKSYCWGIVRKAKDAQRIYNYAKSNEIEVVALTPKDPYWETPHMRGKHGESRRNFNVQNYPFMLYDPDPAHPGPPQRTGAPSVQQALMSQSQGAKEDIYATTGVYPPSMGNGPELKSGKAINAETEKGDRGSYVYQKNLERSQQYTYEQIADLAPKVLDTDRVIKIQNADGSTEDVRINQKIIDTETQKPVIVNNLAEGSYLARAKAGASFMTKKAETVQQLKELAVEVPLMQEIGLDIVIKNMEINETEELHERIRKHMITQGTVEPTEEEAEKLGLNEPQPPDPMQEELIANLRSQTEENQMKVEKMISEIENKDADTQKKILEGQNTAANSLKLIAEALKIKLVDLGLPLDDDDAQTADGTQAVVDEVNIDVLEGQEIAGSLPMNAKNMPIEGQIDPNLPQPDGPSGPIGAQPGVDIPAGFNDEMP